MKLKWAVTVVLLLALACTAVAFWGCANRVRSAPVQGPLFAGEPSQPSQPSRAAPAASTEADDEASSSETVYITRTGQRFHLGGCSSLRKSKIPISRSDAEGRGYTACGRCQP